jgi:hypothetical protein
MLTITIKSTQTTTKSGVSAKGKPYSITEQEGFIELNDERRKLRVPLADGAAPFPVGDYHVGDGSFFVGDYGRLEIGRLDLVPSPAKLRNVG